MKMRYANGLVGLGLMCWAGLSAHAQAPSAGVDPRLAYHRPAAIPFPAESPYSPARAALGRQLFFDPILSASGTVSCASCHQPSRSWGDGLALAVGDNHEQMSRRSPTLLDIAWLGRLGWDGAFKDIESVSFVAITGSANMGLSEAAAVERLSAEPGYRRAFEDAFGATGITRDNIEAALATYERTIVSGEAPFDRWVNGDQDAIGDAAKRGFALFNGAANCASCHGGWAFTDGSYHDIGVGKGDDVGRGRAFPNSTKLRYAFKTPTLRNVTERGPYMHDGSVKTLEEVIDLYDQGGIDRPSRAEAIKPLGLTSQQKTDLLAFLQTLTSEDASPMPPEAPP